MHPKYWTNLKLATREQMDSQNEEAITELRKHHEYVQDGEQKEWDGHSILNYVIVEIDVNNFIFRYLLLGHHRQKSNHFQLYFSQRTVPQKGMVEGP